MKRIISTPHAPQAIGPYSQAIESNGTLYVSGQIALDPATGNLVNGDIRSQTDQALKNIGAILKAAGYTYEDVVKCTVILSDMDHFAGMNEVYIRYFDRCRPARATFSSPSLPKGALVEVESVAAR